MPAGGVIRVGTTDEMTPGEMRVTCVQGKRVVVVNLDGEFYAFGATCPHRGGPLAEGQLLGNTIQCPWHHHRYDVRTGRNVYPSNVFPPQALKRRGVGALRCYQVKVAGDTVFLEVPQGMREDHNVRTPQTATRHRQGGHTE